MQKHPVQCTWLSRVFYIPAIIFTISICALSCTSTKNVLYFKDLPKDTILHNLVIKDFELKIKKEDLLSIAVSSLSNEGSAIFNAPQASGAAGSTASAGASGSSGFLVDINGNITYPKLGSVHVEGLTRDELKNILLKGLQPYLKEAVVTVSFVNHKVTVMGEVNSPQVISMAGESLTLLQVLVLCGGISKTARKDNVLVIRENGGDKEFKRLNLDNSSIFHSPFYYLRPDDIVYVEPDPSKNKSGSTQQVITYITTGLSLLFLILSRIK